MPRPAVSPEKKAAIALLARYAEQMDALMRLLARARSMSPADKTKARGLYQTLEDGLTKDCEQLARKESEGDATQIETAFLLPALLRARADLTRVTNSNPLSSRWLDAVHGAKGHIDYFLDALKR